jgi:hypothetical protein
MENPSDTRKSSRPYGVVVALQQRTEPRGKEKMPIQVWNVRVERYDTDKGLPSIQVEMRGNEFIGSSKDGDQVEILDNRQEGRLLVTDRVRNMTTDSEVRVGSRRDVDPGAVASIITVVFVVPFFVVSALSSFVFWRPVPQC